MKRRPRPPPTYQARGPVPGCRPLGRPGSPVRTAGPGRPLPSRLEPASPTHTPHPPPTPGPAHVGGHCQSHGSRAGDLVLHDVHCSHSVDGAVYRGAIGGERPQTCAARLRLAGRDLRGAISGERPARRDWRGDTVGLRGATDG